MLGLAAFVWRERSARTPMLPLGIFSSRLFTATNAVTFAVYAALGGVFLFLVLALQVVAGYSPLAAGVGAAAGDAACCSCCRPGWGRWPPGSGRGCR